MIYTPRGASVEPATCTQIDTRFVVSLPQKSKGFITSTHKGNKIFQGTHRLWVEVFKKSFEHTLKINKNQTLASFCRWTRTLKISIYTKNKETIKKKKKLYTTNQRHKRKYGGFFNCYDFVFAGINAVNQAAKVTRSVIKAATNNINKVSQKRINQIISQGGQEVERMLPKMLRGAIEDVYQTPFRLLGKFGKQQFNKTKQKRLKQISVNFMVSNINQEMITEIVFNYVPNQKNYKRNYSVT